MKAVLIIGHLLIAITVSAQKYSAAFGEMPESEIREALTMKNYSPDPGAEALALFRSVDVELGSFGTKLTYTFRTKIFNSTAFDKWSDYVINVRSEGITTIKGYCYNLVDGQIIKRALDESNIHKKKLNWSWDSYTLTMPNVREGAVIEFSYMTMLDFGYIPPWSFQLDIPVLYSEYYLDCNTAGFRAETAGQLRVRHEELKKTVHQWSVTDAPAFKEEPYMPNSDLFESALFIWQYERPWEDNGDIFYWKKSVFALPGSQASTVREKVEALTDSVSDPYKKIKLLVNYLKENVQWSGEEDIFAADFNEILKNKKGTAADINLLLNAMLSRAGINSNPVLLSTRNNGHHHVDIPTIMQFNYVITQAVVGTDTLYLDATERKLQHDALPLRCLNDKGLLVSKDVIKWVDIEPKVKRKIIAEGNFTVDKTGEMKGKLTVTSDGYQAFSSRRDLERRGEDFYKDRFSGNWQIEQKKLQNEGSTDLSFIETYDVVVPDHVNVAEPRMYINPFVLPHITSNPFKADKRLYPIEFDAPVETTLLCNITLPDGFVVEELPQSKVLALPGNAARAIFNISSTGKQVQLMTRLQINRTLFMPDEYGQLKEFYTRLFAKQGEFIVLKKQ